MLLVVTIHGLETSQRYWQSSKKAIAAALSRVSRVVLVGEPLQTDFTTIVNRTDHFRIVFNGFRFPQATLQSSPSSWSMPLKIISVSNLHEGKGIDLTLQALAKLNVQGFYHWVYTIIGAGYEREKLEAMVDGFGLRKQVTFVGAQAHNKVYEYLAESQVFLLPSYREAFGIAYLEAMACGFLAIGVQGEGPEAFIEHLQTGLLLSPRDINDIVNILKEIMSDPDRMQQIARDGQQRVLEHFTWECHAKNLSQVFAEILPSDIPSIT